MVIVVLLGWVRTDGRLFKEISQWHDEYETILGAYE